MTNLTDPLNLAREALLPNGAPQRSPAVIETAIQALAARAYTLGQHDALMSLMTAEQAAAELGIDSRRVRRIAATRGVGWHAGREWIFTPADIDAMRVRTPGRPRKPRSD